MEHFDVLIVGAGLSGIGAAYRLQTQCPTKRYLILEGRAASGGTWDLFRYPGVRSDSDIFTLGYPFRPWDDANSIADGSSILSYVRTTAAEFGIDDHIRYHQTVISAAWESGSARWGVTVQPGESTEPITYTCSFLYMCSGYYSYDGGYTPEFAGVDDFAGVLVHPQSWPEDLDCTAKRVVVIGSGATAVTLLPALADEAAHITMLQRSPSYVTALPRVDPVSSALRQMLSPKLSSRLSRWKNVVVTTAFYQLCQRRPRLAKKILMSAATKALPDGYDVQTHFNPKYGPWDQRMCIAPDGDLFEVITSGKASVVTGQIESFVRDGIRLESGQVLPADIIVSATGLQLKACGGISIVVDGFEIAPGECFLYRGCLLSDVPNFAMCFGYTNASWTLRADLTSRYVCRLINYMDDHGHLRAVPRYRERCAVSKPLLNLSSGYVQRGADILPRQGAEPPWRLRQNYILDYLDHRRSDVAESMEFATSRL